MDSSQKYRPNPRWWFGLFLTVIVILLLIWNIRLTNQLLSATEQSSTKVTGYSTKRLDEMWMKINSMEAIIHTRPLVECGDWDDKRKGR
jgi:hypothetical protein